MDDMKFWLNVRTGGRELTETNAEKLERIKSDWFMEDCIGNEDVDWLIKRAERANDLFAEIQSHAPQGRNYTNQQVVELKLENAQLREGLEEIKAYVRGCYRNKEIPMIWRIVDKANEALGKDEPNEILRD